MMDGRRRGSGVRDPSPPPALQGQVDLPAHSSPTGRAEITPDSARLHMLHRIDAVSEQVWGPPRVGGSYPIVASGKHRLSLQGNLVSSG
jgi:hypothetical protein